MKFKSSALLVLVLALVLVAAGCGGKKKAASPPKDTTTAAAQTAASDTTTAAASGSDTSTDSSSSSSSSASSSKFNPKDCPQLAGLAAKVGAAVSSASSSANGDPAKAMQNEAKVLDSLAGSMPKEIRGDIKVLAEAISSYGNALAKAGFKPGSQPTPAQIAALTKAGQSFDQAKVKAASDHLQAWGQTHCH